MRMICSSVIGAAIVTMACATPAWSQRDVTAGQRSRDALAQDAVNAMVDAANRINSVDPTDPVKRANGHALRGDAGPALTPAVARALNQAQLLMAAGKAEQALFQVQSARTRMIREADRLKVYQFLTLIHLHLKDEAAASAAAEAAADMAAIPESEKKSVFTTAALLALNAGHHDKAMRYAHAMQALGMEDSQSQAIIGRALYFGGDRLGAIAVIRKQIDAAIAAGRKPDRAMLEIILSAQAQSQSPDEAAKTLELLKQHYDDPRNWQQIIDWMHQIDVWYGQTRDEDLRARKVLPGGT